MSYPETLSDLQEELLRHSKDGRSDALFRLAIALDQFGSLTRHLTHDTQLNPVSRPHGSKASEASDAGHAIVQLLTYCALRDIDLQSAVNTALDNLRDKDFIRRDNEVSGDISIGKTIVPGILRANALVIEDLGALMNPDTPFSALGKYILVTNHPTSHAHILRKFAGIVTNHGGVSCHAAIIAREYHVPCIVGTGDATKKFQTGDVVEMNAEDTGQGRVYKIF